MLTDFTINETPNGAKLVGYDMNRRPQFELPLPASREDLNNLIRAAACAPLESPRVEIDGVQADQTENGVRVRNVARQSWFDIPWRLIVKRMMI